MAGTEPRRDSRSDVQRARAAWRDALPVGVVMGAALVAMVVFPDPGPTAGTLLWGVLVLAGAGLTMRAAVRSLRRADEYQRLLQLQALAVGFAVVVVLLLVAGLLTAAQLVEPRQSLSLSLVGGVLAWLGVRAVQARKA